MDANSMTGNEQHKGERSTELGDLPNEILQEIISKLPIKNAIQTAVISKNWENQWKNMSKVKLVGRGYRERKEFTKFVDKLVAVLNTSCIKILSLSYDFCDDSPMVNGWLSAFIKPTIQELSLDFESLEDPLTFSDSLFRSKDLTHFHLNMPQIIMLPSHICFPSLSTLSFRDVVFPDSLSTQRLFTGCPSLKKLSLIDCNWSNVETVHIACPMLQILIIREWEDDQIDSVAPDDPTDCRIVITADNLKTFTYDGDFLNDYVLDCNTSSITNGAVEVHPPPIDSMDAGFFVLKLLKALSEVEKLSISDFAAEALRPYYLSKLPLFNNLVKFHVESGALMNLASAALLTILRRSPRLESLDFAMGVFLNKNALKKVVPFPSCFETSLKTIRIYGFTGRKEELFAIKFFLTSTPQLDALWIFSYPYGFDGDEGVDRLHKLRTKILGFARVSVDCEIYFE